MDFHAVLTELTHDVTIVHLELWKAGSEHFSQLHVKARVEVLAGWVLYPRDGLHICSLSLPQT